MRHKDILNAIEVVVWSTPGCSACRATTRMMDQRDVPYEVADLSADESQADVFRVEGHTSLPVVEVSGPEGMTRTWSGFRTEEIRTLSSEFFNLRLIIADEEESEALAQHQEEEAV